MLGADNRILYTNKNYFINMDRKKIIQISLFVIVVGILAWLLWWMFWREGSQIIIPGITPDQTGTLPTNQTGAPTGQVIDPVTGLPISGQITVPIVTSTPTNIPNTNQPVSDKALGGLTTAKTLLDKTVQDIVPVQDGKSFNYYDSRDNKFYRLNANGEVEALSDKRFFNVQKATWSPTADKAILEYPDGTNIYYDFTQDKQVTLPAQMAEFNFSKSGENLGFKWESALPNDDWLGVATPNGSDVKFVEPMNNAAQDVQVAWSPNSQIIAFYREGAGQNQSEVYFIGQNGENFKSLTVNGRGFEGQWLDDGKNVLYQIYNDASGSRPSLWLTRADGDNVGMNNNSLGVQTWLDKCTVSGASAYCAVPEYLPEGAAYVPEVANNIPDQFYKIDLSTGAKTLLAKPIGDQSQYSASQVMVSSDGSTLYFVDQATGKLYSINL